ncbi:hypothetical protein SAY87_025917 [Trapa incisa]|uniref:Uncharacterized protein n=1 Tax=Trapa incisa TaxID=236973 RepID=A0AAN7GSR5_9MYRT|nr:hypothetical protein SAY87_025917 [Trapa incisa]
MQYKSRYFKLGKCYHLTSRFHSFVNLNNSCKNTKHGSEHRQVFLPDDPFLPELIPIITKIYIVKSNSQSHENCPLRLMYNPITWTARKSIQVLLASEKDNSVFQEIFKTFSLLLLIIQGHV